jgi:hypothetical protein
MISFDVTFLFTKVPIEELKRVWTPSVENITFCIQRKILYADWKSSYRLTS